LNVGRDIEVCTASAYTYGMKAEDNTSEYLSFIQAARLLGVSRQWVDVLLRTGRIPYEMRDGRRRIKRSDFDKFAEIKRRTGRPPKKTP
jgi:excisionase family DNA binding protein